MTIMFYKTQQSSTLGWKRVVSCQSLTRDDLFEYHRAVVPFY